MTPCHPPEADENPAGVAVLEAATADLRAAGDSRWIEVSDRVLAKAMTATRRSHPVRAQATSGPVHVSEQVLVTHLRAAVDEQVPGSAPVHIYVHTSGQDRFSGTTVCLVAEYGRPLLPIADRVRDVVHTELSTLLGPVIPKVSEHTMHVHFCGVTEGHPHRLPAEGRW